jgi:dolichyl-phosphate-mannose-protein mannosyltransferase
MVQKLSKPLPVESSEAAWARWEMLALPSLLFIYLALATYKIHLPGLYYDEMLFVGPATGQRPYLKICGLPLLTFPYIGALKSWLYTPIFKLFGVSAVSIRLPAILISCGTLTFGYLLLRRILTPLWAVAFTLACAVHPGFVLLTRVDLGPIALMLFFKALCLYLLIRWLETSRFFSWSLAGLIAACTLGFFDKFNFIWFVVALVVSTVAVYGREIFQKMRTVPLRRLVPLAVALVALGLVVLWIVFPLLQKPNIGAFSDRVSQIWRLYESATTGGATAYLWFKSPPVVPSWPEWAVLSIAVIFLLSSFIAFGLRADANKHADRWRLRFCLWCLIMFGITFIEMVLTPQAGGPHHVIMLFPFDVLAGFVGAFLFAHSFYKKPQWIVLVVQGCVLLALVVSNLKSLQIHFSKFKDMSSFRGRWSPHVELLARYLDKTAGKVDSIFVIDWGIGFELTALCRPEIGRKVHDAWPTFLGWSADKPDASEQIRGVLPPGRETLYVSFVPEESVFPQALQNFEQMRVMSGNAIKALSDTSPAIEETYQVFKKPPGDLDHQGDSRMEY